jgi:hypothetical protein
VMTSEGRLAYLQSPPRIDVGFVERAQRLGHPERRFRFSTTCVEAGCPQWTGDSCAVVDEALASREGEASGHLPACGIRRSCRWFSQRGPAACAVCPTIVADTGGTLTWRALTRESSNPPDPMTGEPPPIPVMTDVETARATAANGEQA